MAKGLSEFKFKNTDNIGAAGAEDDEFLKECFVDTGLLELLTDLQDRRLILLGRTGAGKSALLTTLEDRRDSGVVRLAAQQLALTYVANSTILNFFAQLNVNLDPFFKLLWRHVITVEILQRYFSKESANESPSLIERLKSLFNGTTKRDKEMRQAIDYLAKWGQDFWLDTEYRVREIATQVETQLQSQARATLGPKVATIDGSLTAAQKLTESERAELVKRGQEIVSTAQVQDLHRVLPLLDGVLENKQRSYYVIVDHLDEDWVEERLRYKLIMALLQTAREFNIVKNAKVIVALRRDLIDRVFRLARDSGFQEEKFHSLYLPLKWTKGELIEVLDKRIETLVRRRYTKEPVSHRDVLPKSFRGMEIDEYVFSVATRPRDVISLFNECIKAAASSGRFKLADADMKLAEGEYSRGRLRALADEWSADYPRLIDFARVLQQKPPSFKLGTVIDKDLSDLCLSIALEDLSATGLVQSAIQAVNGTMTIGEFKLVLFRTFYQVGLIGIKRAAHEAESWVDEFGKSVSFAEMGDDTSIVIHPMYWRALGIQAPARRGRKRARR